MQTSKEYAARAWILEDLRQHLTTDELDEVILFARPHQGLFLNHHPFAVEHCHASRYHEAFDALHSSQAPMENLHNELTLTGSPLYHRRNQK